MIQEQFVSFKTAKLLKDKGFMCGECHTFYTEDGKMFYYQHYHDFDRRYITDAPTQQMAMRWLREIHKLHITVFSSSQESWMYRITKQHQKLEDGEYGEDFVTYEDAVEAAIKYCLENLI